jgi:hypothetical protein
MTDTELKAYRIAGEMYGRLRAALIGGRLSMAYEANFGTIDYRWSFRKNREEQTVNQCVDLHSLAASDEVNSLFESMLLGLNTSAEKYNG